MRRLRRGGVWLAWPLRIEASLAGSRYVGSDKGGFVWSLTRDQGPPKHGICLDSQGPATKVVSFRIEDGVVAELRLKSRPPGGIH